MQNYFEQDEKFSDIPHITVQLTFVATFFNILMNLLAPVGQILLALMEARTVLFISIVFSSLGLLLASFGTQVRYTYCRDQYAHHLLLCADHE